VLEDWSHFASCAIIGRMALVTDSVEVVPGPLPEGDELDARVEQLRCRFPLVIIDRYLQSWPSVGEGVFVAPGAALVGDVRLGEDSSIWYGCVLRGDLAQVSVGARSNVQDGAVIHVADQGPCEVGDEVVIGHRAVLHACRVESGCLVGIQATVLDDAVIGHGSVIGAGSVVTPRTRIPPRSLVLGAPGKVVKMLAEEDEARHRALAMKYVRLKSNYLRGRHDLSGAR
jgi:carbonic anhydrase/acetyltransferase-like protein (isoleucine patch superfamily)